MLTLKQIIRAGENFEVFAPVERAYTDRYTGGFVQKDEPTLCYKGLDCIFFEKHQFLVLRMMNGQVAYCGYCYDLAFFLMLCKGISPGGIFNDYPLPELDNVSSPLDCRMAA